MSETGIGESSPQRGREVTGSTTMRAQLIAEASAIRETACAGPT